MGSSLTTSACFCINGDDASDNAAGTTSALAFSHAFGKSLARLNTLDASPSAGDASATSASATSADASSTTADATSSEGRSIQSDGGVEFKGVRWS